MISYTLKTHSKSGLDSRVDLSALIDRADSSFTHGDERAEPKESYSSLSELMRQNAVDALPGISQGIRLSWRQTSQRGSGHDGQIRARGVDADAPL